MYRVQVGEAVVTAVGGGAVIGLRDIWGWPRIAVEQVDGPASFTGLVTCGGAIAIGIFELGAFDRTIGGVDEVDIIDIEARGYRADADRDIADIEPARLGLLDHPVCAGCEVGEG